MDTVNAARIEEVLKRAQLNGNDKNHAFDEFQAVLIEWMAGEPLGLLMDGDAAWMLFEIWMDPEEGLIKGGDGYEHFDFGTLNQMRARLFQQYNMPLKKKGRLSRKRLCFLQSSTHGWFRAYRSCFGHCR